MKKKLYLENIFNHIDDLKAEYQSKQFDLLLKFRELEESVGENCTLLNLEKFLEEKENFLNQFFKTDIGNDNTHMPVKLVIKECILIFLNKLKQEIQSLLIEVIKEYERRESELDKDSPSLTVSQEKEIGKGFESYRNHGKNNRKILNSASNEVKLSETSNFYINSEQFSVFYDDYKSFIDCKKQDIEVIQYYLQIFIFEKNFILLMSNIVSFMYGIKSNIFIDKKEHITIDFYAQHEVLCCLANHYNYPMQLKIMINAELINYENKEINNSYENTSAENLDSEFLKAKKKYTTKYYDYGKNSFVFVESLKDKNLIPFHKVNENDITLHPPFLEFNYESKNYFRLYNQKDEYAEDIPPKVQYKLDIKKDLLLDNLNTIDHKTLNIFNTLDIEGSNNHNKYNFTNKTGKENNPFPTNKGMNVIKNADFNSNKLNSEAKDLFKTERGFLNFNFENEETDSIGLNSQNINSNSNKEDQNSVFRNIDKIRLIKTSLNLVFNFEALAEYPEYLDYQIIRNDSVYKEKLKARNILSCYLDVFNKERIFYMNEILRNYYGEKVAYYFYFASHYIKWLIYPSILAVIYIVLDLIFSFFHILQIKNFSNQKEISEKKISLRVYFMFIFLFFIIIWALTNIKSWIYSQTYYNYCWGMDGNSLDSKINSKNFEKAILTMGIVIPISSRFSRFKKRFVTIFISLLLIIFTIFINFVLFELSKIKSFNEKENETKLDSILEASLDVVERKGFIAIYPMPPSNDSDYLRSQGLRLKYKKASIKPLRQDSFEKDLVKRKNENLKDSTDNLNSDAPANKNSKLNSQYQAKLKKLQHDLDIILKPDLFLFSYNKKNHTNLTLSNYSTIPRKNITNIANTTTINTSISKKLTKNKTAENMTKAFEVYDLEHIKIKATFWYHLIPIISVILRNIMSKVNYSTALWMVKYEKHTEQSSYEDSFLIKMVCYEFINYYFYLYYIIFYRQFNNLCLKNNCYKELGSQLTTILITSTLLNFYELLSPHITVIFRKIWAKEKDKNKHKQQTENEAYYEDVFNLNKKTTEDPRNIYHDRIEFFDIMTYEYLELIMNFGYIILFGISSPVCFLIAFVYAIVERFTDALKLTKSHNVNIIGMLNYYFLF